MPTDLCGQIERVTFFNEDNGFTIARVKVAGQSDPITVVGNLMAPAPGEVLEIRAPRIPECQTWNFQLDNYWMESLYYRYHRITVNKHTARYEDD